MPKTLSGREALAGGHQEMRRTSLARGILGTPLRITTYDALTAELQAATRAARPQVIDFSNTQIVTLRRVEPRFQAATACVDSFIPDGMPLIWCLNFQGAGLKDRVYGPTFMRKCVLSSPAPFTHYFLGGSQRCLQKLIEKFRGENPTLQVIGSHDGYFSFEQEEAIVEEILRLSPDFLWVGLGTPKQQEWISRHKHRFARGVILAVGFAFDVNAGTKPDAPAWMQRLGLTWVFRALSEPRRLGPRYLKYNFLFLWYLFIDGLRGRAWSTSLQE